MTFEVFYLGKKMIYGTGSDSVGSFIIQGDYEYNGKVKFNKKYLGKHAVNYTGTVSNEGYKIEGEWIIENTNGKTSGTFVLKRKDILNSHSDDFM